MLLTLSAVLTALVGARSTMLANDGSDHYHEAIRQEIKRGAALVEDVRYVYQDEAPLAIEIAEARNRARANSTAFSELPGSRASLLGMQGAVFGRLAQALTQDVQGAAPDLGRASAQAGPSAGEDFDPLRRLGAIRRLHPELMALDPQAEVSRASSDLSSSEWLAAAGCLAALGFFAGALAQVSGRHRHRFATVGFACVGAGFVTALVVEVVA